jgi:hypothetical protein
MWTHIKYKTEEQERLIRILRQKSPTVFQNFVSQICQQFYWTICRVNVESK